MYAAKYRNDEAYVPDGSKVGVAVKAVVHETNAAAVNSPARNMHALLDSQYTFQAELLPIVEPFRPIVSLGIISAFCTSSWTIIAGFLLPVFW